jgi:formylglycine-generating enzyme
MAAMEDGFGARWGLVLLCALAGSCSSSATSTQRPSPCTPRESIPCKGSNGCDGERVCDGEGSAFSECTCRAGSGGAGGSGNASGSSGSGGKAGPDATAGAGGSVPDGSADATTNDAGTDGPAMSCPTGAGPRMVSVPASGGGAYCIDTTEVTKAQYRAFLADAGSPAQQPAACSWNSTVVPSTDWPPTAGTDNQPAVWVDWCDAQAFCKWAGKRLCGRIGGGTSGFGELASPTINQWFNACSGFASAGYAHLFPYGDTYDPVACNGNDNGQSFDMLDVGSTTTCHSPEPAFSQIFDMSGNAYEWEDSCNGTAGSADQCRLRGGGTNEALGGLRCDADLSFARDFTNDLVGFRCCAP